MDKYIVSPSFLNSNVRESNNSHLQLQRVMMNEEGTIFKIFDKNKSSKLKYGKIRNNIAQISYACRENGVEERARKERKLTGGIISTHITLNK